MSKEQKGFIVYGDIKAVIDELNDEQVAQLFRGMVDYFMEGKVPKFSGVLKFVWITIRQQMDRDKEKYDAKCEKNRKNIKEYWERTKEDERKRTYTNATNKDTDTDKDTKTDTDTTTTTDKDTKAGAALKQRGGGGGSDDDKFDLWKRLTPEDIDRIYDVYPESGGYLIDEVAADVKAKRKEVKNARSYILGYAKRTGWDDKAERGPMPWEAS